MGRTEDDAFDARKQVSMGPYFVLGILLVLLGIGVRTCDFDGLGEKAPKFEAQAPETSAETRPSPPRNTGPFQSLHVPGFGEPEITVVNEADRLLELTLTLDNAPEVSPIRLSIPPGEQARTRLPPGLYTYVARGERIHPLESADHFEVDTRYTWTFKLIEGSEDKPPPPPETGCGPLAERICTWCDTSSATCTWARAQTGERCPPLAQAFDTRPNSPDDVARDNFCRSLMGARQDPEVCRSFRAELCTFCGESSGACEHVQGKTWEEAECASMRARLANAASAAEDRSDAELFTQRFCASVAGEPPPAEKLGKADVQRVLRAAFPAVRACHQKHTQPKGKLKIRWEILPDGSTSEIRIKTRKFRDTEVGACVRDVIAELAFPPHAGPPVPVTYPFVLR